MSLLAWMSANQNEFVSIRKTRIRAGFLYWEHARPIRLTFSLVAINREQIMRSKFPSKDLYPNFTRQPVKKGTYRADFFDGIFKHLHGLDLLLQFFPRNLHGL